MQTTEDLQSIFEEVNFACFDDELPTPAITYMDDDMRKVITNCHGYDYDFDGICIPTASGPYLIGISTGLNLVQVFNTMIHEIVHIACMEKWNYPGHGKKFKQICKHILDNYPSR